MALPASSLAIGLRQARVFLAIADRHSITYAARALNRSQTSVTRTLHDLELMLGEKLFDRCSRGVTLTAFGECLLNRAREAAATFAAAGEHVSPASMTRSASIARFFEMDASDKWLDAFLGVVEHQTINATAEHLGLTPAAVSASLRKLEDTLNTTLFERTPSALLPTSFGRELARHAKLARSHLRTACDEIESLRGNSQGRVVLGTLPFARTIIVPRAITQFLRKHSNIDVATIEGPYDDLVAALRCGDIDLIIGALRGAAVDRDLREEAVIQGNLSAIVRAGHPLLTRQRLEWEDLLEYQWILPRRGTPTRKLFECAIDTQGLTMPEHVVETSSLVIIRGILLESNRITVLSPEQIAFEAQTGLLAVLPFDLVGTERPIGITCRRTGALSPAAELFATELRAVARSSRLEVPLQHQEILAGPRVADFGIPAARRQ